jgi:hypothetical protein
MFFKSNWRFCQKFGGLLGLSLHFEKKLDVFLCVQLQNWVNYAIDEVEESCSITLFVVFLKNMFVVLLIVIHKYGRSWENSKLFIAGHKAPLFA